MTLLDGPSIPFCSGHLLLDWPCVDDRKSHTRSHLVVLVTFLQFICTYINFALFWTIVDVSGNIPEMELWYWVEVGFDDY